MNRGIEINKAITKINEARKIILLVEKDLIDNNQFTKQHQNAIQHIKDGIYESRSSMIDLKIYI